MALTETELAQTRLALIAASNRLMAQYTTAIAQSRQLSATAASLYTQINATTNPVQRAQLQTQRDQVLTQLAQTDIQVNTIQAEQGIVGDQLIVADEQLGALRDGRQLSNTTVYTPVDTGVGTVPINVTVAPAAVPPNLRTEVSPIGGGQLSYDVIDTDRGVITRSFNTQAEADAYVVSQGQNVSGASAVSNSGATNIAAPPPVVATAGSTGSVAGQSIAQYTNSETNAKGTIVNAVLDAESNTITYTVTAPNGAIATVTTPASESGNKSTTVAAIRDQLAAAGADTGTTGSYSTQLAQTAVDVQNQNEIAVAAAKRDGGPIPITSAIPVAGGTPGTPAPTTIPDSQPIENEVPAPVVPIAYDEKGNLLPGFELNENNDPVRVGAGVVPPTAIEFAPPAVDPNADPYAPNISGFGEENDPPSSEIVTTAPGVDDANPYGSGYDDATNPTDADVVLTPAEVAAANDPVAAAQLDREQAANRATLQAEDKQEAAAQQKATLDKARAQNTIANQRSTKNNADWRVKLRLAPQANYLYAAPNPGILKPLAGTGGVIFPYTPSISTVYKANYSAVDLTHSNYKGYFYQGSAVEPVTLSCPFTAQSTTDAEYLLAVIHFFKSVTKMFYGQDPQRGTPPPLVYLTGLGQWQFNEHPCLVQSFTYEMPPEVDYIRAYSPNVNNSNMLSQRQASNGSTLGTTFGNGVLGGLLGGAVNRLLSATLPVGGMVKQQAPQTLGSNTQATYVPTKMTISITLLPIQSRKRISQDFSLAQYANGDLLKGGFW